MFIYRNIKRRWSGKTETWQDIKDLHNHIHQHSPTSEDPEKQQYGQLVKKNTKPDSSMMEQDESL